MIPITRVAAADLLARPHETMGERYPMAPATVLVVDGLVGDAGVLAEAAAWTDMTAGRRQEATRVQFNDRRTVDNPALKQVIEVQRQLMRAIVDWQPKAYSGMANNVPPTGRYPVHINGLHNLVTATTLAETSSFRIHASKHGGIQEAIDMEPDVTVVMCNGALDEGRGVVWHSTFNNGGSYRQTVVQHGYRRPNAR